MKINTVSETIAEHLRLQIITGELTSGQRLNEVQLSSTLGISRPPLREALRILESEHLVVSTPRKGTVVRDISIEDLRELFEVREMIECYAVDLLKAKNIRELPKMDSALEEALSLRVPYNNDPGKLLHYQSVLTNYHISLIESTANSRLIHLYKTISLNLMRYQFMYLSMPGSVRHSMEEHRQILDLIKKSAHEKAQKLMRDHLNHTFALLMNNILKKKE